LPQVVPWSTDCFGQIAIGVIALERPFAFVAAAKDTADSEYSSAITAKTIISPISCYFHTGFEAFGYCFSWTGLPQHSK
jgi:hypothetical protein